MRVFLAILIFAPSALWAAKTPTAGEVDAEKYAKEAFKEAYNAVWDWTYDLELEKLKAGTKKRTQVASLCRSRNARDRGNISKMDKRMKAVLKKSPAFGWKWRKRKLTLEGRAAGRLEGCMEAVAVATRMGLGK